MEMMCDEWGGPESVDNARHKIVAFFYPEFLIWCDDILRFLYSSLL